MAGELEALLDKASEWARDELTSDGDLEVSFLAALPPPSDEHVLFIAEADCPQSMVDACNKVRRQFEEQGIVRYAACYQAMGSRTQDPDDDPDSAEQLVVAAVDHKEVLTRLWRVHRNPDGSVEQLECLYTAEPRKPSADDLLTSLLLATVH